MTKQITAMMAVWLTVASTAPLFAQQQQAGSLGNLWPLVEEYHPGIASKRSGIDAARLHEQVVKSATLPQVRAQLQNTYGTYQGSDGAFFPQPGFFNVSGGNTLDGDAMAANSFGSATLEWELYSFGKQRKETEAAGALYDKAMSEKDAYLLQLKKTLSERYITLLYNDAKLKWTEKNAQRINEIRNITAGLSAAGLRPAADSLLASSSYIQALGERDKWDGQKTASYIQLLELFGGDTLDLTASAGLFVRLPDDNLAVEKTVNPQHPFLIVLDKQSRYYLLRGEAQKRSSLPSLRALGGYAFRGTGTHANGRTSGKWKDGFSNNTNNVLVGIGITWNITKLRTNALKGAELFKEAESAKWLHNQYAQAMQADLSASRAKIAGQLDQLQKTALAVKQSKDAYDMYLARYKSGLITLSELLQIQLLLEQAEKHQIEASRSYWSLVAHEAELTADFEFLFNNL